MVKRTKRDPCLYSNGFWEATVNDTDWNIVVSLKSWHHLYLDVPFVCDIHDEYIVFARTRVCINPTIRTFPLRWTYKADFSLAN